MLFNSNMEQTINNYIDFGKLFLDLYNEQEEILIAERIQADHFEKILQFKEHAYKDFDIIPEECDYDDCKIFLKLM